MARGIISTILGGVAGGLRGYASQQERRREEAAEERRREEERRRAEAQFAFQAAMSGGTPGARLRTDEAAVAAQRLRNTPLSRVLDQAPLFEQPSEAPVGRSALEAALQTRMPAPSFSAERRNIPQVTPITEDEDYFQLSSPEGQVYSFMTPEARTRQQRETARDVAQEENLTAYNTLLSIDPTAGEYNPGRDYSRLLDRAIRREDRAVDRVPESALIQNVRFLREQDPSMSLEEAVNIAGGRAPSVEDSGQQAFIDAVREFASREKPSLGGLPGRLPSQEEIRAEALRIAPLYNVGRDAIDQLLPRGAASSGQSFLDRFATPRLGAPSTRVTQPAASSGASDDLSSLSDEELLRIIGGG